MNLYKKEIYKSQLKHGLEWKRHKYLYKDANGNYVYPEDVKNNVKSKVQGFVADQKQKSKDRKFVKKSNPGQSNEYYNAGRIERDKRNEESYRRYINSPENRQREYNERASRIAEDEEYKRSTASYRPGRTNTRALEKQKAHTAARKEEKKSLEERRKINQQQNSAHEGYWNGSGPVATEELERQKERTKVRKERKEAHGTNKQRAAGKAQLDKIHNRSKAESSAKRTHNDPDNSLSLGRDSTSYDRKTLDQINSAHRGATRKTRYDERDDNFVLENRGHLTSDGVERQKHKTRLRKLRQRRGK